uniref:T-cell receptor alpha joining 39 n=1 Tax=Astyanax mexicanus TaxID=7994 RepID=A0A8B9LPZ6_ASTMX
LSQLNGLIPDKSTINKKISLNLRSGYCTVCRDCVNAGVKIIFGRGTQLVVQSQREVEPSYYKVKQEKDSDNKEYCLATGFTQKNATNGTMEGPEAVLFTGQEFYSRISRSNCTEEPKKCEKELGGFREDAKSKFVSLCIFMLRILFFKTIIFNVLMTFKVWLG